MLTDIEIAQQASLQPITEIAHDLGLRSTDIECYGSYKAKVSLQSIAALDPNPKSKLILVTAISPTPAGEGKTTTSVGLADALKRIGKKTMLALREPSLGPVFGMKGGATGGGQSQVVPMEDINLHFTGDFNAIQLANNLLAAMIDNHIHHGNALDIDVRRIQWRRVLDLNDRALRDIIVALGGPGNGFPRSNGFDIVAASEVMAIFCLASSLEDLKNRLAKIVIGYNRKNVAITAKDLNAQGSMAVLLKTALQPNLVQTLEHTPTFIHGGPFANIAHGCSSVIATKAAMKLADYVVTEAGFGADLGAEKFIDIKCRKADIQASVAVLVVTIRALKFHGGLNADQLSTHDSSAVQRGLCNLERHLSNIREHYGLPCVIALNHFMKDSAEEIQVLQDAARAWNVPMVISKHWELGGQGAEDLAHTVVELAESNVCKGRSLYNDATSLWDKTKSVAQKIYGAKDIAASTSVRRQIENLQNTGYGHFPVCIAKTQYSFSTDATQKGAPSNHVLSIREVRLSAGAEFVVMVCGDIMTMPGLPKEPAAHAIDLDESGNIVGLF